MHVLTEDKGGQEVPPHGRRLEHGKEDAEVLGKEIFGSAAALALPLGLQVASHGQVGALGRPQWAASHAQHG